MSARLRAYVVDDEELALRRLTHLLLATGRVEVAGEAMDPEVALREIPAAAPDALFLDIRMPKLSGFDLLARLPGSPLVVFVTGWDQYAVRAFEAAAVDYLVKPVQRERLEQTLDRLDRLRQTQAPEDLRALLDRLAGSYLPSRPVVYADRVSVDLGQQGTQVIEVARVTHFLAQAKGTLALTERGSYLVDRALGEVERRLDPREFVRIHRGALVNLAFVQEVRPLLGGRVLIRLRDGTGTELEVARDRVRALKDRLIL